MGTRRGEGNNHYLGLRELSHVVNAYLFEGGKKKERKGNYINLEWGKTKRKKTYNREDTFLFRSRSQGSQGKKKKNEEGGGRLVP